MTNENTFKYKKDSIIYNENDDSKCVFYIAEGIVCEERNNNKNYYRKGTFFAEFEYLLDIKRQGTSIAQTDCTILRISDKEFSELLEKTPEAATKAMSKLSFHFKNFYFN